MLHRVILGPRRILLCTAQCGMYRVLHVVTVSACDHRYRPNFMSYRVFRSKEIDLHVLLSCKTLNSRHYFYSLLVLRGDKSAQC